MKHRVSDDGDLRKYFVAIPNIVLQLGLNPYELALYAHFKQAAGDNGGVCWKSRATIAKEAHMSTGMVTKARAALEKPQAALGGFPLIRVSEVPHKDGGKATCHITVTDIWAINMTKYAPSYSDVVNQATSPSVSTTSQGDEQRHTASEQRHHTTTKKNSEEKPIRKTLEEEYQDGFPFRSEIFVETFTTYEAFRREINKPLKPIGRSRLLSQLSAMGVTRAVSALNYSMACGYQGVYEEKKNGNGNGHAQGMDAVREVLADMEREGHA